MFTITFLKMDSIHVLAHKTRILKKKNINAYVSSNVVG